MGTPWHPGERGRSRCHRDTDARTLPTDTGWLAAVQRRTPLGRLGQADDIAEVIRLLHGAQWVTGQILEADGGLGLHSPIDAFGEHQRG